VQPSLNVVAGRRFDVVVSARISEKLNQVARTRSQTHLLTDALTRRLIEGDKPHFMSLERNLRLRCNLDHSDPRLTDTEETR